MNEDKVLQRFMKEHFPFRELKDAGLFTQKMKGDYQAQAERVRKYFGYTNVYEYGAEEVSCHLSFEKEEDRLSLTKDGVHSEPFTTVTTSIY